MTVGESRCEQPKEFGKKREEETMEQERRMQMTRAVLIFVALAVVDAELLFVARDWAATHQFRAMVFVGTGSAVFGAGLTFFLIRMFQLAEPK